MPETSVVRFKNVSFAYGAVPVLENVNFTVREKDLISVVGPNGGGKTTLLKLILGLLHPDAGQVLVFDRPPAHARPRIGYTPQYAHYDPQFPLTVMDVVLMGHLERHWGGPYSKRDRRSALTALDEVELADLTNRPFAALSGGQRQRVLIARALACEPDLLLLDEPTANIDLVVETRIHDILESLNRRMTILMVSHDLGFVSHIVEKVICVNRRVVVHPTSEVTGECIRDCYGGDFRMVRHDHFYPEGEHNA